MFVCVALCMPSVCVYELEWACATIANVYTRTGIPEVHPRHFWAENKSETRI